jgi:hypothetical protein
MGKLFVGLLCGFSETAPAQVIRIEVASEEVTIQPYHVVQCAATGFDAAGSELPDPPTVNWTASGGGALDADGLYTATTVGTDFGVTATSTTIPELSDSATVD